MELEREAYGWFGEPVLDEGGAMRPRSAAILACRIIAIILGIQVITQTVTWLIFAANDVSGSGSFWVYNATTGAVAWFLWTAAAKLADAMARGTAEEPGVARSTANIHAAAFSVVGVVLIVGAVPALIGVLIAEEPGFGGFSLFGFGGGSFGYARGPATVIEVTRIAVGVALIAMSGSMAQTLARRYPEPEPPASTNNTP